MLNGHGVHLESSVGKSTATLNNGERIEIPNRGLRLFPKRAILRVGMLLRDSEIAIEKIITIDSFNIKRYNLYKYR